MREAVVVVAASLTMVPRSALRPSACVANTHALVVGDQRWEEVGKSTRS